MQIYDCIREWVRKRKREREGKRRWKGGERFHDMWLCHQTEPTSGIDLAFTAAFGSDHSILQPEQARSTSAANLKRAGDPRKGSSSLTMRGATPRVPSRLAKSLCSRETLLVRATSLVRYFFQPFEWAHLAMAVSSTVEERMDRARTGMQAAPSTRGQWQSTYDILVPRSQSVSHLQPFIWGFHMVTVSQHCHSCHWRDLWMNSSWQRERARARLRYPKSSKCTI